MRRHFIEQPVVLDRRDLRRPPHLRVAVRIRLVVDAHRDRRVAPQMQRLQRLRARPEPSMMERFGLLTFPNGRRGAAVIEGELVIHHAITSYWGVDGPARDRFFAFQKETGELVWSSTPGTPPKDSSFSSPVIASTGSKRVLYCGTGCGNLVALNVLTGDPLWRYHFSYGGVNASVLLHGGDKLIAIHGKENIDTSEVGRMAAIRIGV